MSKDRLEQLRKRMEDRLASVSQKLKQNPSRQSSSEMPAGQPLQHHHSLNAAGTQASLQSGSAMMFDAASAALPATAMRADAQNDAVPGRPEPLSGSWRCIVNSPVVSIDLVADTTPDGGLSARGSLIYVATYKVYEIDGKGSWTLMPPDEDSTKWLFDFRLIPSTHPIFHWFASPTDSPAHLHNRFYPRGTNSVVETSCERIG